MSNSNKKNLYTPAAIINKKEGDIMFENVAPLSNGFMVTTIVGFLISWVYVLPRAAQWGFTFMLFFILMFIASVISMTYSPVEEHLKPIKGKK